MQFVPGIVGDQTETSKKLRKLLCLQAGQHRTFCMIAPIILSKSVSLEKYNCYTDHLESDLLMSALGHTPAMLAQLHVKIIKYQGGLVREYKDVRDFRFPNFSQERETPAFAAFASPIWTAIPPRWSGSISCCERWLRKATTRRQREICFTRSIAWVTSIAW
jgi:hypothetical protein